MKGYINKRAKIKYSTDPSTPDLSKEGIEKTIGLTLNITDPEDGDTLRYRKVGNEQYWTNIPVDEGRKWRKITVTADGTSSILRYQLTADNYAAPDGEYYKQGAVFIAGVVESGSAEGSIGVVMEFYDRQSGSSIRKAVSDLAGGIPVSGRKYFNAHITPIGDRLNERLWCGNMTTPSSALAASTALNERIDGYQFWKGDITYIEIRTTTAGVNIPAGSSFDIWVYSDFFRV